MTNYYCFSCNNWYSNKTNHLNSISHSIGNLNQIIQDNWCKNCDKLIIGDKRNNYCSQSCAAIINNKKYPKKKLIDKYCKKCNQKINRLSHKDKRILCTNCNNIKYDINNNKTYNDLKNKRIYQKNSRIRNLARQYYKKSGYPMICLVCKYNKHVEICHYKGISEHSNNSKISEINKISNLIPLCRNHHWELDKLKEKYIINIIEKYIDKIK